MSTAGPHKTAIQRCSLSRPVALALEDGLLSKDTTFFDYGCGRGGDLLRLHKMRVRVSGWDPAFFPEEERNQADVVNLGYVVNVIEDPAERTVALCAAWELAEKLLIVSARLEWEARTTAGDFQGDGIVTRKRTFQKFFSQDELRNWIQSTVGRSAVAAAPGVFYVFRETSDEQIFVGSRLTRARRVPTVPLGDRLFDRRQDLLRPLIDFLAQRGRLPVDLELAAAPQITKVFGSIRRAFSLIRRVTGPNEWEKIRGERRDDVLVFLALATFGKRAKFHQLPDALRYDIRAFFGTYIAACTEADHLLYSAGNLDAINRACGKARVGKLLPGALYIHHSTLGQLPPVLRVYEGCGRQLAGTIEGVTVVKLGRRQPKVSYLVYPEFDRVGHPVLAATFIADLSRLTLRHHDYRSSANPPVLHRKELLVSPEHPFRKRFARLTAEEQRIGLLASTDTIGNQHGWRERLARYGVTIRGHRVTRSPS